MRTLVSSDQLHAAVGAARAAGQRIGFVPTMGNLHAGHFALIACARQHADFVVASVFVNPTQFGPNEDLARYPRTPEADARGLAEHGCHALFLPAVEEVYPFGIEASVKVSVPQLGDVLEGARRPGHFDGVATVVSKLFNLVQPDVAIFGQKDFQQLLVVRRLVRDLGFPVQIIAAPTHREASGLAMSSRNQYLTAPQRDQAVAIHATLEWMRERVLGSDQPLAQIEREAAARLESAGFDVDYTVLRKRADLDEASADQRTDLCALIAARLGSTRLIDNLSIAL